MINNMADLVTATFPKLDGIERVWDDMTEIWKVRDSRTRKRIPICPKYVEYLKSENLLIHQKSESMFTHIAYYQLDRKVLDMVLLKQIAGA